MPRKKPIGEIDDSPVRATIAVARDALHGGVDAIETTHAAIAAKPFGALRLVPGLREVSERVRVVHDGITGIVYQGVRAGIEVTGWVADRAARLAPALPEREANSAAGLALAALNGVAGDRLESYGPALALPMTIRHAGTALPLERESLQSIFPNAGGRIALFVHGLAANEACWSMFAGQHYGDQTTSYGSRLAADLGFQPLFLRYNSGLHISENGRLLSELLTRFVEAWPSPIEGIALIGHSMGGLVLRSACHHAGGRASGWTRLVSDQVYLGSPHLGAPLEKFGNAASWALARVSVTRSFAEVINRRSAGIKDLRYGAILDEHWREADPDALLVNSVGEVPLLDTARHWFVSASLTAEHHHPVAFVLGDWLVRKDSALGKGGRVRWPINADNSRHFGSVSHLGMVNHPAIYEQIRTWLDPKAHRPSN